MGVRYLQRPQGVLNSSFWPNRWKIQLRNLNNGEPHPSAQTPVLSFMFREPEIDIDLDRCQMSITSSRLAFLCTPFETPIATAQLTVWDWTTGEILFVRHIFLVLHFPNDADCLPRTLRAWFTSLWSLFLLRTSGSCSSGTDICLSHPRCLCSWTQHRSQQMMRGSHKPRSVSTPLKMMACGCRTLSLTGVATNPPARTVYQHHSVQILRNGSLLLSLNPTSSSRR